MTSEQKKKRVNKACDTCRIKKTKCNGKKPCDRCLIDNKICTFSERRRDKEKNYPSGYIELLETRCDLLTKSLNKLMQLSVQGEDMMTFFAKYGITQDEFNTNASSTTTNSSTGFAESDHSIPINKLIDILVSKEGLLKGEPIEWDSNTQNAAHLMSVQSIPQTQTSSCASSMNDSYSPESFNSDLKIKKEDEETMSDDQILNSDLFALDKFVLPTRLTKIESFNDDLLSPMNSPVLSTPTISNIPSEFSLAQKMKENGHITKPHNHHAHNPTKLSIDSAVKMVKRANTLPEPSTNDKQFSASDDFLSFLDGFDTLPMNCW